MMETWVFDVTDADFETAVIERSKTVPVVIDFWAPWCGPCRILGPLLERITAEHEGEFVLAKVNVDDSPRLSGAFGVRSIPMVLGMRDGQIVSEFVGALPESAVRQFLSRVLPSPAEKLALGAEEKRAAGALDEAEALLRRALDADPRSDRALLTLAATHADRGRDAESLAMLERVAPGTPFREQADQLAAKIRIRQAGTADEPALRAKLETDPGDLESRFSLAQALAAKSDYDQALAQYLEIVRRDRSFRDDAARKAMLDVFALLGSSDERVERYRSELAKILFR
jgi:putative thioredoxin